MFGVRHRLLWSGASSSLNDREQSTASVCGLRGFQSDPMEDIHLTDCDFKAVEKRNVVENVRGLELRDVRINGKLVESLK